MITNGLTITIDALYDLINIVTISDFMHIN